MSELHSAAAERLARGLFAGGAGVILAALAVVAVELGPRALTGGAVHESEPRALAGVLFYPGHALRELPHLALLALVWLGAVGAPRDGRELGRRLAALGLFTAACGAALFAAAAAESGAASAWRDFAQSRAASDLAGPGIHFRFHLLSDVAIAGLLFAVGRTAGPADAGRARRARLGAVALAVALFGVGLATWGVESITAPRFVGHAGREVVAFVVVALPVVWALALRSPAAVVEPRRALGEAGTRVAIALAALAVGALAWHAAGVDLLAASSAPGRPLALNLAAHQLEHLFDVIFLAAAGRLVVSARRRALDPATEAA